MERRRVTLTEARALLPELAENAKHHEQITILTKHGKDVAAIVPVPDPFPNDDAEDPQTIALARKPSRPAVPTRQIQKSSRASVPTRKS